MPGVTTQILTAASSGTGAVPANATYFAAGIVNRGPVGVPIKALSLADLVDQVDGYVSFGNIYYDASAYFKEAGNSGGTYVLSRVVGPGATIGTGTLNDQADSPTATLTVNAANPGAWSGNLNVTISTGPLLNTFNLAVVYNGVVVEQYKALQSPADAVAKVNAVSTYIVLVNANSVTVAPDNNPANATITLSAGSDDRAHITTQLYEDALAVFTPDLGSGVVAIPGQVASSVATAIESHCQANSRIGLLALASGGSVSSADSAASSLIGATYGQYVGIVWPNVTVPDGAGGSVLITPEGAVAGLRARVQAIAGPWQPPAGGNGIFTWVSGVEQVVAAADADNLDAAGVSVIRMINGGPRLYGWRSLSADLANYELLSVQDLLNYVLFQGNTALEQYVFDTIDGLGQLLAAMAATMKNILVPIANAGGVYGASDGSDPGYTIDTGSDVNTPASLAQNKAIVACGIRPAPSAAIILFQLTKLTLS